MELQLLDNVINHNEKQAPDSEDSN